MAKIRIWSYLSGYEDKVRDYVDIDEDEVLKNPSLAMKKAKDHLIAKYGGDKWSLNTQDKVKAEMPPINKPAARPGWPTAREETMKEVKEIVQGLNTAEIREMRKMLTLREKEARTAERAQRETLKIEAQIKKLQEKLSKIKST